MNVDQRAFYGVFLVKLVGLGMYVGQIVMVLDDGFHHVNPSLSTLLAQIRLFLVPRTTVSLSTPV